MTPLTIISTLKAVAESIDMAIKSCEKRMVAMVKYSDQWHKCNGEISGFKTAYDMIQAVLIFHEALINDQKQ